MSQYSSSTHQASYALGWTVIRLQDFRLLKQLFYGELTLGKRPQHEPSKCKCFPDFTKGDLNSLSVSTYDWGNFALNKNGGQYI